MIRRRRLAGGRGSGNCESGHAQSIADRRPNNASVNSMTWVRAARQEIVSTAARDKILSRAATPPMMLIGRWAYSLRDLHPQIHLARRVLLATALWIP